MDYDLIVVKTLERVYKNYYYIIRGEIEMGLFSKSGIKEMQLPYIVDDFTEPELDDAAASISIEAYGIIDGEKKYLYNTFWIANPDLCDDEAYYKMLEEIKSCDNKQVNVKLKYRNKKLKAFEIDIKDLAAKLDDDRFLDMETIGWGINDKSCKELL